MRIMALDYGDARTGVAVSDPTGTIAGFTTVIESWRRDVVISEIVRLVKEREVEEVVLGLPRNMDGSEGEKAAEIRAFAGEVEEAVGMPVRLWDERRSTIEAHSILHANGRRMKNHRKNVDAVAAALILEGYLVRKRQGTSGAVL